MDARRLPVQSRTRSVILLLGVVIGLLVAGLAIPFVFGERLTGNTAAPSSEGLSIAPGTESAAPTVDPSTDLEAEGLRALAQDLGQMVPSMSLVQAIAYRVREIFDAMAGATMVSGSGAIAHTSTGRGGNGSTRRVLMPGCSALSSLNRSR